jgi:hypothetical protein
VQPREKLNELMRAAARTAILPGREPIADSRSPLFQLSRNECSLLQHRR